MLNRVRKKIILHINSYYVSTPLHRELVVTLDELHYQQLVYIPIESVRHIDVYKAENLINGKLIYSHCFGKVSRLVWPVKMFKLWFDFKNRLQWDSCQLIHAHSLIVNGLIAYLAYRKWNIFYIVSIRDTDVNIFMRNSFLFRKLGKIIMENASAVITLSPAYRDIQLPKYLPSCHYQNLLKKIHVVPNGINEFWLNNRFKRSNLNDIPVIIFVGRIIKRKNLGTLITACNYLNNNNFPVRLYVVGDGPLLNKYKRMKYITQVTYYGNISDMNELLNIYRSSDVLVVPSYTETFGLIYPEAMTQSLPVIFSKGQGFDGFFPDGHVGFSADPDSPIDISDKIRQIISNYTFYSTNAYIQSEKFSWTRVAKKLADIYNSIV